MSPNGFTKNIKYAISETTVLQRFFIVQQDDVSAIRWERCVFLGDAILHSLPPLGRPSTAQGCWREIPSPFRSGVLPEQQQIWPEWSQRIPKLGYDRLHEGKRIWFGYDHKREWLTVSSEKWKHERSAVHFLLCSALASSLNIYSQEKTWQ